MASFVYNVAKAGLLKGDFDFDEAGNDIRVTLLMTNTTADTEKDKANIAAFTTLDEYDGSGFTWGPGGTGRKAMAQSVVQDDGNLRGEFQVTTTLWASLGAGTRQAQGMLLYKHVSGADDSLNIPIAWIDTGGFPFTGNGGDVTITWNAEGVLQAT